VAINDHDTVAEDCGRERGPDVTSRHMVGGCYEPGFAIVKPGLGSVRVPANRNAEGEVWLIFRV
jgi:hypothetical protein